MYLFGNEKGMVTKMPSGIYKRTIEHSLNLSKALKGKKRGKLSDEHRQNLSKVRKGMKFSEERNKNVSKALKGKKFSKERRLAISRGIIKLWSKRDKEER